ncbi:uncharacterized protein LOC105694642 [Orussus abietinus]|uniref:uncharacterized protein LOC105694642 n=1 Tax=Orussus abietinus TaxID=222816 RepID=UPI000625E5D5|nr:uncharacterized protein LOC105694642 [Orussus abietinus]
MTDKKGDGDKNKPLDEVEIARRNEVRKRLRDLCECDKLLPEEEVNALGRIAGGVIDDEGNRSSSDEFDQDLDEEYQRLIDVLNLPGDTYSLTKIDPNLPPCVKYGMRSGVAHQNMKKFSPLSRGFQGEAVAVAAYATTALLKSRCWNELVIDQIIDDGDTYYCESYKEVDTDDRRNLTIMDLKTDLEVQKTHKVHVAIDDAAYAGTFRSENPTELHLIKALELFFKRYDAGILTSLKLKVAIWKESKFYSIFDGQPRKENCEPAAEGENGSAKLILVRDLIGVIFIILEKSHVNDEPFVLYGISIRGIGKLPLEKEDPEEPEKSVGKPKRRPSGYKIQAKFRALVRGSYHLLHTAIPKEFQGKSHLIIALAALIYSRLINANKWTSAMIDLIFNEAHIYLVDLARVLEKKLDDSFELKVEDLIGDVILGVYAAKVKVEVNVIPGQGKKGKATLDSGIRDFFATNSLGILEIKKVFYALWKDGDKYYFLDPFPCDGEGFRVDEKDPEEAEQFKKAFSCVTMNSSVNEIVETILENTGNKEKDPFILHGLRVLYVKTGTIPGGSWDRVIYREKRTNRRPQLVLPPFQDETLNECKTVLEMTPKPRPEAERFKDVWTQFPDLMQNVEDYVSKDDEPTSYAEVSPANMEEAKNKEINPVNPETAKNTESGEGDTPESGGGKNDTSKGVDTMPPDSVKLLSGYEIINPHRLLLRGSKNCLSTEFEDKSRGRQGLTIALAAMAYAKMKPTYEWRNLDVDGIIDLGNKAYEDTVVWIRQGSPQEKKKDPQEAGREETEADEEDEGEEEDEDAEEGGEGDREKGVADSKGALQAAPSHLDVSMLPDKVTLDDNEVFFKRKMNFAEGDANPLANLGEGFESYFKRHDELIVENKKLMYAVWKAEDKYFVFNPYGAEEEGWRFRDYPASFLVTDTINELTDVFYGILEFNDPLFFFHFIGIEAIQPGDKYVAKSSIEVPEQDFMERYKTKFLPITDEDLIVPVPEIEPDPTGVLEDGREKEEKGEDDDEEGAEDEEDEGGEKEEEEEKENEGQAEEDKPSEVEKPLEDPLTPVKERDQADTPSPLNLCLLTGSVSIEQEDDDIAEEPSEAVVYEKLKYQHPRPYVLPRRKVLCLLLDAKHATKSIHSLVSRFSVDSKLAVKQGTDLPTVQPVVEAAISNVAKEQKPTKLIKLHPKKYLISRTPPIGFIPLRAIHDKYIQDQDLDKAREKECEKKKLNKNGKEEMRVEEIPEIPTGVCITPSIIPLGPTIKTLTPKKKAKSCLEMKKRNCRLCPKSREDAVLEKIICNTEDVLMDLIFPGSGKNDKENPPIVKKKKKDSGKEKRKSISSVRMKPDKPEEKSKESADPETCGFKVHNDVGVIEANMCLENRQQIENCHFKVCYYTAILCILAKIRMDVDNFRGSILDQFILAGDKIYQHTGKLRYKPLRWFHNIEILGVTYNVMLKQTVYCDPEDCEADILTNALSTYLEKNHTGVLVFNNVSYAFWHANGRFYFFDPYACDEQGIANEGGFACLLEFCDENSMIERIKNNTGESAGKPYRIYSLAIAHAEVKKRRRRKKCRKVDSCKSSDEEPPQVAEKIQHDDTSESEKSLIELTEWVAKEKRKCRCKEFDLTIPGFAAIPNFNASTVEVIVLENDITTPILAPFRKMSRMVCSKDESVELVRKKTYDRRFKERTIVSEPLDLCIMAWGCIHDPMQWGRRTIKGIYEASKDFAFDSLLASEDSTVEEMTDGIMHEFGIANYTFRAVFAPLHEGTLYATVGWNLAMSLKKVFGTPVYTGAVVSCGKGHVGVMRRKGNYYAWWTVQLTKRLKIIVSDDMEDFLKLIVKAIDQQEEARFQMRVVTISYARKLDPDCTDLQGLHETLMPTTSLAEIHKKRREPYDLDAIFRSTVPNPKPIFVLGTVGFQDRDKLTEPRVKRCYFVAVLAVMVKRDIIQSPVPGMVDKVVEVAENLYREFPELKYHTEHILRNVTIMNRIFEFRDCSSTLVNFTENPETGKNDFFPLVRKHLKCHFKKHNAGILHFTNCCYGFWYSAATRSYYYLDPYQCNEKGRRVQTEGKSCLCIFSCLCHMVRNMCLNRFPETTGFFIHRLHVESINVPPFKEFQEDPMWMYLDFHWSFNSFENIAQPDKKRKKQKKETSKVPEKPIWNHYTIEVSNLIYSVWGTLGSYDTRFGERAGKNQAAICVAVLAMQYICHPSQWGPVILDSAVICGDCYYSESQKSSARRGRKHPNKFNLQPCFKVFPHIWSIEFKVDVCGILYDGRDGMNLTTALIMAFNEASNVIIECGKVTIGVLVVEDGYYVVDPRWTGPPLFTRNHGALYVLRCRNTKALVYALTKMLNTNLKLEFRITPVAFTFSQEDCKFAAMLGGSTHKRIMLDPVYRKPGRADEVDGLLPGAETTADEDAYLRYRRNLVTGIKYGHLLAHPSAPSTEPLIRNLKKDNLNNALVSTTWHINIGKPGPRKRANRDSDSLSLEVDPEECLECSGGARNDYKPSSLFQLLEKCDEYPKIIDLLDDVNLLTEESAAPILTPKKRPKKSKVRPDYSPATPLDCEAPRSFLMDVNRGEFKKRNLQMADEVYQKYHHRILHDSLEEDTFVTAVGPLEGGKVRNEIDETNAKEVTETEDEVETGPGETETEATESEIPEETTDEEG